MPKLMLPVQIDKFARGVKLTFKGSLDPWLFVDLEGDTVRVYRQSMMTSSFMQARIKCFVQCCMYVFCVQLQYKIFRTADTLRVMIEGVGAEREGGEEDL